MQLRQDGMSDEALAHRARALEMPGLLRLPLATVYYRLKRTVDGGRERALSRQTQKQ
jgi:hypothetical protein